MSENGVPTVSLDQSLVWQYDAIHGSIDLKDVIQPSGIDVIRKLIRTSALERLRRVSQLGFASQTFPSSDHSRYAHSLGTMHMMRFLINRVQKERNFSKEFYNELHEKFPEEFTKDLEHSHKMLSQHLLVAALLQDTGELPFNKTLELLFKPSKELKSEISKLVNIDCSSLKTKQIFTLGCGIINNIDILKGFNLPLLVYLITGRLDPDLGVARHIASLRHMMDGIVDADRLDYVFRDAHHTFGSFGSIDALIGSLLYYDEKGPVFADTGPVSSFLALRAYLYTTVYAAPANRFKFVLLFEFLKGLSKNSKCSDEFYSDNFAKGLTVDDFMKVDDDYFVTRIKTYAGGNSFKHLSKKSRTALELLLGNGDEYSCLWLPPPQKECNPVKIQYKDLPDNLFFDTFRDRSLQFYGRGGVRISAPRFKMYGECIPLEECGGPFRSMISEGWSLVPVPDSVLLFTPKQKTGHAWQKFNNGLEEGWLFRLLIEKDWYSFDLPDDTRKASGFSGPSLFVSYTSEDIDIVKQVVSVLHTLKQKYFLFSNPINGICGTPAENSVKAVEEAERVLMIVSNEYVRKYQDFPEGYVAKEFYAMLRRRDEESFNVLVLSCDEKDDVASRLPWSQIGYEEIPYFGKALRGLGMTEMEDIVRGVVEKIRGA
jgi:HD superfamily phosphohydrolase